MRSASIDGPGAPLATSEGGAPRGSGARPFAERFRAALAGLDGGPPSKAGTPTSVTVTSGDTLWSMVRHQLETSSECVTDGQVLAEVRRVSAANRLDDPDVIVPGQRIELGGAAAARPADATAGASSRDLPGAILEAPTATPSPAAAPTNPLDVAALISGHADRVTSAFGMRDDPLCGKRRFHAGVDLAAATGTPVRAAASGVVSFAGEQHGYGRVVVVDHGGGVSTVYAHASELLVRAGDHIDTGTELLRVGSTGRATGPHLHFEVRKDGVAVDPAKLAHLLDDSTHA